MKSDKIRQSSAKYVGSAKKCRLGEDRGDTESDLHGMVRKTENSSVK